MVAGLDSNDMRTLPVRKSGAVDEFATVRRFDQVGELQTWNDDKAGQLIPAFLMAGHSCFELIEFATDVLAGAGVPRGDAAPWQRAWSVRTCAAMTRTE